jgi:uncharacterized cofD-like protein
MNLSNKKLVLIGGGTGSFTLLSSLKKYFSDITALVNMADDGGSTGVLRDELGVLPPGDVRQCLVALARDPRMRDLFNYRFEEGTFAGHSFGNLFLTAVEKTTDDFAEAVDLASDVLNISGRVVPITLDPVTLVADNLDSTVTGQDSISSANLDKPFMRLEPTPRLNPAAKEAMEEADFIVIAPGRLYGSLAPALIVPGVSEALAAAKAKKAYVCNLVTKPGQTDGFKVHDFATEIERLAGKLKLDYVLYNNAKPDANLLEKYAQEGEYWVDYDESVFAAQHYQAIGGHFVLDTPWRPTAKNDPITRTLIRHDGDAIARALKEIA